MRTTSPISFGTRTSFAADEARLTTEGSATLSIMFGSPIVGRPRQALNWAYLDLHTMRGQMGKALSIWSGQMKHKSLPPGWTGSAALGVPCTLGP